MFRRTIHFLLIAALIGAAPATRARGGDDDDDDGGGRGRGRSENTFGVDDSYDYRDRIGLANLHRKGYLRAKGDDIRVGQVEAAVAGAYAPNVNHHQFEDKDFELMGIPSTPSSHATRIGTLIYGNEFGIAPEVDDVLAYSSLSLLGNYGLNHGQTKKPRKLNVDVLNNSWTGQVDGAGTTADVSILRRLDYAAWKDEVVVVNSTANDPLATIPRLLASSYNGIAVGTSTGSAGGYTTLEGARVKPDMVVPLATTSDAAAIVAGSAALLLSESDERDWDADALSIKAALMAGAEQLPGWRRGNPTTKDDKYVPLDLVQGAGELRIDRSYHILAAGEQKENRTAGRRGWASEKLSGNGRAEYFEMKLSRDCPDFSAVLTWNRRFEGSGSKFDNLKPVLADLSLQFLRKEGKRWILFASSDSKLDNVELLALQNVPKGWYRLSVQGNMGEEYAIAWDADYTGGGLIPMAAGGFAIKRSLSKDVSAPGIVAVPEPSLLVCCLPAAFALARRPRRL